MQVWIDLTYLVPDLRALAPPHTGLGASTKSNLREIVRGLKPNLSPDWEKIGNKLIPSPTCPNGSPLTPQKSITRYRGWNPLISGWAWLVQLQAGPEIITSLRFGVGTKMRALKCVASSH